MVDLDAFKHDNSDQLKLDNGEMAQQIEQLKLDDNEVLGSLVKKRGRN